MPARYSPTTAWQIDFGGRTHDVTPVLLSYDVMFGSQPALDGRAVRTSTAIGSLSLSNRDHRYDPDSPRLQVDENSLRRRNPCRLLMDGAVAWEGLASFATKSGTDETGIVIFKLEGKYARELLLGRNKMNTGGGDCTSLARTFAEQSGIPLTAASDNPVGLVYYEGNWLIWLDNFGRYAGGWCIENNVGDWEFVEYARTPDLPVAATLGLEHEPANGAQFAERVGHVRNYAECVGSYWASSEDETLLGSVERKVGRNFRFTARLRFERNSHQQSLGWDRFSVTPSDIGYVLGSADIINAGAADVTVQTFGYAAVPPQTVRVSGYGRANRRTNTTPEKISITEFDTQNVYGQQQLRTPPWFPADFRNLGTHFKPWLRNLSQPVEALQVSYNNRQLTRSQSNTLRDSVVPGNAVDVSVVQEGGCSRGHC